MDDESTHACELGCDDEGCRALLKLAFLTSDGPPKIDATTMSSSSIASLLNGSDEEAERFRLAFETLARSLGWTLVRGEHLCPKHSSRN
jgi:hypothetical protein